MSRTVGSPVAVDLVEDPDAVALDEARLVRVARARLLAGAARRRRSVGRQSDPARQRARTMAIRPPPQRVDDPPAIGSVPDHVLDVDRRSGPRTRRDVARDAGDLDPDRRGRSPARVRPAPAAGRRDHLVRGGHVEASGADRASWPNECLARPGWSARSIRAGVAVEPALEVVEDGRLDGRGARPSRRRPSSDGVPPGHSVGIARAGQRSSIVAEDHADLAQRGTRSAARPRSRRAGSAPPRPRNGVAIRAATSSGVNPPRSAPAASSRRATSASSRYQPPVISRTDAATSASVQPAAIISWRIRT